MSSSQIRQKHAEADSSPSLPHLTMLEMVDMPRRPRVSSTTWWIKHQFSRSFTGELLSLWNQMVHIYFGVYNASICFYKTDKSCKNRSFIPCVKGSKMSPPVPVIPTASFLCLVVSIDSFYTWLRWCRHLQNWKQVNPAVTSAAVQSWSPASISNWSFGSLFPMLPAAVWLKLSVESFWADMDPTESEHSRKDISGDEWWNISRKTYKNTYCMYS